MLKDISCDECQFGLGELANLLSDLNFAKMVSNWYFVTKTVRKKCSSDQEKLLKFEAEGCEFAKILRSLQQLIKQ